MLALPWTKRNIQGKVTNHTPTSPQAILFAQIIQFPPSLGTNLSGTGFESFSEIDRSLLKILSSGLPLEH